MSVNNGDKCFGCRICESLCPVGAISFQKNKRGFEYPIVDIDKCIECGICEKNCGLLSDDRTRLMPEKFYALKNKNRDIKLKSSSGGAFMLLAEEVISVGGIVYGCKIDDNINAVYGRAETLDDCVAFMGSKYVQSDMKDIIKYILNDLKKSKTVLFTGTPCECLGVKTAVSNLKHDGKLILCDFYCHGAPSPMIFDDFKKYMEKKYNGNIITFRFRDKEKVLNPPNSRGMRMNILQSSKQQRHEDHIECDSEQQMHLDDCKIVDIYDAEANNKYFELFKFNYISRESCYECPCIGIKRDTDITIGDYWRCEKYHPDFFDREGISVVTINTVTGRALFEKIKEKSEYITIEKNEIIQPMISHAPLKKNNYADVWKIYYDKGFEAAAELCCSSNQPKILARVVMRICRFIPSRFKRYIRKILVQEG